MRAANQTLAQFNRLRLVNVSASNIWWCRAVAVVGLHRREINWKTHFQLPMNFNIVNRKTEFHSGDWRHSRVRCERNIRKWQHDIFQAMNLALETARDRILNVCRIGWVIVVHLAPQRCRTKFPIGCSLVVRLHVRCRWRCSSRCC